MGNAQARLNYIFYTSCATGPLSVLGSALTLVSLVRSKRTFDTYARLVSGVALYDIIFSVAVSFGPVPVPAETGLPSARGNLQTCTAQGALLYIGSASFAYFTMLMWYYVAVIRYGIRPGFMARWIEPWMHVIASGYFLVNAAIGLHWQIFNFASIYCLVAAWPLGCNDSEELECLRGGEHEHLFGWWLTVIPLVIFTYLLLLALVIVAATVVQRYCQSQRFLFRSNSGLYGGSNHLAKETRQVVIQCVLYAVLFSNVMLWSTLSTFLWMRGIEYDPLTDPLFAIDFLALFFFPTCGFFLFLIFLRPTYLRMRKHYSRWKSFQEAIWNPDQEFERSSGSNRQPGEQVVSQNATSARNQADTDPSTGSPPVHPDERVSNGSVKEFISDATPPEDPLDTDPSVGTAVAGTRPHRNQMGPRSLHKLFLFSLVFGCGLLQSVEGLALSTSDLDIVTRQLGYTPTNYVRVSARNNDGTPIAIQTYPLDGGARRRQDKARRSVTDTSPWLGTPFPTLYWLTCPDISRCIAGLEREGYVKVLEQELRKDESLARQLQLAHQDYARARWNSLDQDDREQLVILSRDSLTMERMRIMLECSGIAGSNTTAAALPPVKCLHTHYAHFRSQWSKQGAPINPVGAQVHKILMDTFPDLVL